MTGNARTTFVIDGDLNTVLVDEVGRALERSSSLLKAVPGSVPAASKAFVPPTELQYAAMIAGILNFLLNAWKARKHDPKDDAKASPKEITQNLNVPVSTGYLTTVVEIEQGSAHIELLDAPGRRTIRIQAVRESESSVRIHITQATASRVLQNSLFGTLSAR